MTYTPLRTDDAPQSIRDFVREHVDMQLHDVHTMLLLPRPEEAGMAGGCNFAAVAVLSSLISGASTVFFRQEGEAGPRFRDLLTKYYPWEEQPPGGVDQGTAVTAIYKEYRNPLAHALAVSTRTVGRGASQRILVDTRRRPLGVIKPRRTEEQIVLLEQPEGRPPSWLSAVVTPNNGGGMDIYPDSLYWGTRRLLERLFRKRDLMQGTVNWFAPLGSGVGEE